jgi:hypothetical protein
MVTSTYKKGYGVNEKYGVPYYILAGDDNG